MKQQMKKAIQRRDISKHRQGEVHKERTKKHITKDKYRRERNEAISKAMANTSNE